MMSFFANKSVRRSLLIVCSLAAGWFGSRYWSQQRQLRAGLQIASRHLISGSSPQLAQASPSGCLIGGQTFDLGRLLGEGSFDGEAARLIALIESLDREQATEAVERLMLAFLKIEPAQLRRFLAQVAKSRGPGPVFERLGQVIQSKLNGPDFENVIQQIAKRVIAQDPSQALLFSEAMPRGDKEGFSVMLYQTLALQEPERLVDMMLKLQDSGDATTSLEQKTTAMSQAFKTLAARSLADAQARWPQLPVGPLRQGALKGLLVPFMEQDPQGAWLWSQQLSGDERAEAISSTLSGASDVDISQWLTQNFANASKGGRDSETTLAAVTKLAHAEPAAAIQWFDKMPWAEETMNQDDFYRSFAKKALSEPTKGGEAAAAVLALPAGEKREKLLGYVARSWAEADPTSAKQWIEKLSPEERELLKPRFSSDRYAHLARSVGLDEFAADKAPGSVSQPTNGLSNTQVSAIFNEDPRESVATFEAAIAGGAYNPYVGALAGQLAQTDVQAALSFAERQPEPEVRDKAYASVALAVGSEKATEALNFIQDPVLRQKTERRLAARQMGLKIE